MPHSVDDSSLVTRRRAQLVKAAIKLFSRMGYHAATVKDIAQEAGVSAGLMYQYVPDKQDLLFLALQHIVQRNKEEVPSALLGVEDPIARLYRAIDAYTRVMAANQQAVLLTYRETKSLKPEYIEQMKQLELDTNRLIEACATDCIRAGYLAPTNVELLVYRIIIAAHAWPLKHWRLRRIVTLDEYLDQAIHAAWKDLLLPRGSSRYEELRRAGELRPVHLAGESDDGASRAAGTEPKKRARRGRAA
ncbi:TetR family transcriptional regulator [Bordetella parapertussis]|uniref:TetR-family transcriptional regulator n=4 Tax=Bordetella TaxID=517 RepID=K0MBN4_BORPB|nr:MULTISPECIES: TetR/AcrR family transcriptional regulator [Bordetella]KAK66454.1 transcriptional regulator, TetR family [Bordetella bronchiseptica 980-2]AMG87414.1 TetR family transcriptional regulator [Bordetella bronchiseptica]AOB38125.1 TetR family transcriptional regulator [Bordetella parapertussis]AUL42098.1 TetR family transcriptional regulator [Bordetella parapertussis]AWP62013.1 TetR family transcriptional regulator [Bordetella parapertussis]